MEKLEKAIDHIQEVADVLEQFLIGLVAKSTTWAAAMIPALLIYTAILKHFPDLPPWGAYLIAYVIESLGLTTITNTVEAWSKWCLGNSNGEKSTFWIAFSTAAFYLALNIILVVVLKIAPDYARVATGLLSSLSVVSAVGTVMRLKQQEHATEERRAKRQSEKTKIELGQRELERQAEERKRQDERERQQFEFEQERKRLELEAKLDAERRKLDAKLSVSKQPKSVPPVVSKSVPSGVPYTSETDLTEQRRNTIRNTLLDRGWPGVSEMARIVGAGRTTIYRDLDSLEAEGVIAINRGDDGKITDVIMLPVITGLPAFAPVQTNGNH